MRGYIRRMVANNNKTNSIRKNTYFKYSVLFVLFLIVLLIPFIVTGKNTLYDGDGFNQWYPLFCKWRTMIVDIVSGKGLQTWQWDLGLGGEVLGQYTSIMFDPFNVIVVFFSKKHMDICYMITELLKLYVAGLFATMLVKKRGLPNNLCVLSGLSYAFCGWAIAGFRHEYLLMPLVTLPLMILGVEKIFKKESPVPFIIGIFLSCASSFYFTYMNVIIVGMYVIIRYLAEINNKSFKDFFSRIWKLILYALIGLISATVSVVPTVVAITGASKGDGGLFRVFPTISALLKFPTIFTSFTDMHQNSTILGTNALVLLMIPVIIVVRKKTVNMWMAIIMVIFAIFPITESLLNGLSYPSGRFMYATALFLIVGVMETYNANFEKIKEHKLPIIIWLVLITALTVVATFVFSVIKLENIILSAITILCAVILLMLIGRVKNKNSKNIELVVIVNIILMFTVTIIMTMARGVDEFSTTGSSYSAYENNSLRVANKIKDKDFYRSATDYNPWSTGKNGPYAHVPCLANVYHNAPSNTDYVSTMPGSWGEYNKEVLNSAGSFKRMCVYSADNRCRINFLQNVRYYLGPNQKTKEKMYYYPGYVGPSYTKSERHSNVKVYKNNYNTSLGYVFDKVMKKSEYLKIPKEYREQALMQAAVVDDENLPMKGVQVQNKDSLEFENAKVIPAVLNNERVVWTDYPKKYKIEKSKIDIKKNKLVVKEPDQLARLNFKSVPDDCEIYLKLTNFRRYDLKSTSPLLKDNFGDFDIFSIAYGRGEAVAKHIFYCEGEAQGVTGISDFMTNMGKSKNFGKSLTLKIVDAGVYTFDKIELIAIPYKNYDKQTKELANARLNVKQVKNDSLEGDVNVKKDSILYSSIPYSNGWKVYVDGKETKTFVVDTAFTGIQLEKGYHKITMKFRSPAWPYTIVVSLFGIILIIVVGVYHRKKYNN